jgi:hypothetical protein
MIDRLTADDFAAYIGKTVLAVRHGLSLTMAMLDRHELPGWEAMVRKPFSLILSGPPDQVLPEGLHQLEIEGGPSFYLYVIPIFTPAHDHQDYQIVFN